MKRFLLDTAMIIDYLRGKDPIVKFIDGLDGELCSSYICLAELYEGICRDRDRKSAEEKVLGLFKTFSEVFGTDARISQSFGEIRADLKKKGEVIEDLDILLAATALAENLILVSGNAKHFSKVKRLMLQPF